MQLRAMLRIVAVGFAIAFAGASAAAEDKYPAEIVPQLGHSDMVHSVVFSPDVRLALSGSSDKTLILWDLASGLELRRFVGHTAEVWSVAFSPNGRLALSGSGDNTLKLWDVASGRELKSFAGHNERVRSVAVSPDGTLALSGSEDKTLKLWEVASGRELKSFTGHTGGVLSVAFSPDGTLALSGSSDKTLKLWDLASGRPLKTFRGNAGEVDSVAWSPDGKIALSGSCDERDRATGNDFASNILVSMVCQKNSLKLWDIAAGRELKSLPIPGLLASSSHWVFSPDGRLALSGESSLLLGGWLRLWDVPAGRELKSFDAGKSNVISSVALSKDGRLALSAGGNTLKLWDVATGRELKSFGGHTDEVLSVACSPDGKLALLGSGDHTLKLWDLASGRELKTFAGHSDVVWSVAFSPDGKFALSGSRDHTLKLWDLVSGSELRGFAGHEAGINSVAFSPDGKFALSGSEDKTIRLWDVAGGYQLRSMNANGSVHSVAFSPDGKVALSGSDQLFGTGFLKFWDVASGRELKSFAGHVFGINSVAFSPSGTLLLSGSRGTPKVTANEVRRLAGRSPQLRRFAGHHAAEINLLASLSGPAMKLWDVASGHELRSFVGHSEQLEVKSVVFSRDGSLALSGNTGNTVTVWDVGSGHEVMNLAGHRASVGSAVFSPDRMKALSGSADGTLRLWNLQNGEEGAAMIASPDGHQLTITPKGFFAASERDTAMVAIVRGLEVTTIGQVHQSLYNPDLLREALAGDPNHEADNAAKVINLEKVLDAGPPPAVVITSHELGSRSRKDLVTVSARITDRGKGIGRIEWRINGVTAGVMSAPQGLGPDYDISRDLALDPGKDGAPGENRIEVIAYEGRNLLASLPAQTAIVYDGPADTAKPKLYILAIGINKYVDQGGDDGRFPPLAGSVPDAKAFSAEMEKAGAGQYENVQVTLALDEDATLSKLDETVTKIASEITPRDSFVLYAAAHGYSLGGNYYMIPQDYQGGANPEALKVRAIGQDRIQEWLASRIKAKRAVIILDTCESGALTGGYAKSRTEGPVSEAAVGRLHEATGRPVLTAASPNRHAYENYKGHGVFTYALIEALHKGDTNNNGKIEVTELAAHVERRVPELFAELKQSGWVVKGLAATPVKRGETGEEDPTQTAHFGSTGEDFSLVARLP